MPQVRKKVYDFNSFQVLQWKPHKEYNLSSIFNDDLISELIKKLESGGISYLEHDYLQKIISCTLLIQQYNKVREKKTELMISHYYNWLLKNQDQTNLSPKTKTEYFLLKIDIENYYSFFGDKNYKSPISHFKKLQVLADIWGYSLLRQKESVLQFLCIIMEKIYEIPAHLNSEILLLLSKNWQPILSPIAAISDRRFSLQEIRDYFFGKHGLSNTDSCFENHTLPNSDRLFSLTTPEFTNHLFIPKNDGFDIFEASQVVHEFQHIQDAPRCVENSLFVSEKNALQAERVFLNIVGTGKKGKYCWLESNLFYPILLLKWELDIILKDTYNKENFHKICHDHGMESLTLSSLFDWKAPFQLSAYCAASMELELGWKNFVIPNQK